MSSASGVVRTLSSKGQVAIPIRMQRALGWRPGDCLAVEVRRDAFALRRISPTLGRAIRERRRRTLTNDEVLLLAMLDDPATTEEALDDQLARLRPRRKEAATR